MANHLTLEEQEIIAHMHRNGKMQVQIAGQLGSGGEHNLPRTGALGPVPLTGRPRNAGANARGRQKCNGPRCDAMSVNVCGGPGRPIQSRAARATTSRAIGDVGFRTRRSMSGSAPRRPPDGTGKAVSDDGAESGRTGKNAGETAPERASKGGPRSSIVGAVSAIGKATRSSAQARRGGAVTLVERKSGYLLLGRTLDLRAATVRHTAAELYRATPPKLRKTLTLDNGKEFAEHEQLELDAALKIYFAKPYSAWQRGLNENTNSLHAIKFFPKGTGLANIPKHRFRKVQQLLNEGYVQEETPRLQNSQRSPRLQAIRLRLRLDSGKG